MEAFHNPILATGSLLLIRTAVAVRLTPFLGGGTLPTLPALGLSVLVTLVLLPTTSALVMDPILSVDWCLLAAREVAVGASFGLLAMIAYSVLETAGTLLTTASLSIPRASDEEGGRGTPLRILYVMFGTGAFLLMGGHHAMLSALAASFSCLPPSVLNSPFSGAGAVLDAAASLFSGAFAWAVMVSGPVFVAGLVADALSGIVARVAPSLGQSAGNQGIRLILVQLTLAAALGASVAAAVAFLRNGISDLPVCGV